ncbi:GNAT family N-acetyltransferase [uncultured Tyzzerella sp.]|uniref:GNAT family N-acetyltransferase n=1 Tax=uncultured Tyzzerella sp. TaxID=2321398 RepID=UPI00294287E6|nr:GNAT family N-acetyltransferase [uncultured Tyzzerella sp.]
MDMFFLENTDIKLAFDIRKQVFINEQNVPEEIEIDGSDKYAKNMILKVDNKPIGTGRLIVIDNKMYIGRVAILKEYRKKGYATHLVKFLLAEAKNMGYNEVFIHSQSYVKDFYEKIGFVAFGKEFIEANIPHINMKITF